jgi:hypothetical protein
MVVGSLGWGPVMGNGGVKSHAFAKDAKVWDFKFWRFRIVKRPEA